MSWRPALDNQRHSKGDEGERAMESQITGAMGPAPESSRPRRIIAGKRAWLGFPSAAGASSWLAPREAAAKKGRAKRTKRSALAVEVTRFAGPGRFFMALFIHG